MASLLITIALSWFVGTQPNLWSLSHMGQKSQIYSRRPWGRPGELRQPMWGTDLDMCWNFSHRPQIYFVLTSCLRHRSHSLHYLLASLISSHHCGQKYSQRAIVSWTRRGFSETQQAGLQILRGFSFIASGGKGNLTSILSPRAHPAQGGLGSGTTLNAEANPKDLM